MTRDYIPAKYFFVNERKNQRFLRWILPLKESNFTCDAALFMVPAKALPAREMNGTRSGCKVKSLMTCPLTELATTSMEA